MFNRREMLLSLVVASGSLASCATRRSGAALGADQYLYDIQGAGFQLVIVDETGPFNTWHTATPPTCLLIEGGIVQDAAEGFICHSGPDEKQPIIRLKGAHWDTPLNSTGTAIIDAADGPPCNGGDFTWKLIRRP